MDNIGHRNPIISPPKKLKLQEDSTVTADLAETETLRADANGASCEMTNNERNSDECCPICDEAVTDEQQGLFCESCSIWYHASCCGVDEMGYRELNENEDSEFRCPNCAVDYDMTLNEKAQGAECVNSSQTRENTDKQGLNLNETDLTVISERKESEISKSEDEIAYMRKLKDLTTKEKELNKREKTLRKKEYDTEHLSQQLTTAKALVASLENKVLDIRKENDNLKTHLLASNSISHSNIGNIQPQMGSSQMEMNLTVILQAIENELLRMRLNMQDTAGNTGMKCNPCERNNFSEDKIKFLESRYRVKTEDK